MRNHSMQTSLGADCEVCSRILSVYNEPFEEEVHVTLGKVADILKSDCPHTHWIRNVEYMHGPVSNYGDRDLAIHKPVDHTSVYVGLSYRTGESLTWATTRNVELVFQPGQIGHQGRARVLDHQWINDGLIPDWLSRCDKEHGNACNEPRVMGLEPFRPQWLIDTVKGCIVAFGAESERYLTLSYTWGQVKNVRLIQANLSAAQRSGALFTGELATQLPRTILDAIDLTRALGERYLWVDSLCIVQDDQQALDQHLREMHRIFFGSFLTIVAEDGRDAEFGLRGLKGISDPRAVKQVIFNLANGERVATMRAGFAREKSSIQDYNRRMWTFQEKMFAKRRLIFSRGSIKWQCNCAGWYEDLRSHSLADSSDYHLAPELWFAGQGMNARIPGLTNFACLVREFNQKALTYDEDVSRAFSGIQSLLGHTYPDGLLFGHPELFFDISLTWYPLRASARRRVASEGFKGDPLYDRLPSWSWMGWSGDTTFPSDLEYEALATQFHGFTEPVATWYTIESPMSTSRRRIKSTWHAWKSSAPTTVPEGWICNKYESQPDDARETGPAWESMPKSAPSHVFIHVSEPDEHYWYPVPVGAAGAPGTRNQHQFVSCETSHAILYGSPEKLLDYSGAAHQHIVKDEEGNTIGAMNLHQNEDAAVFENAKIELVAVVKGWTTLLHGHLAKTDDVWEKESFVSGAQESSPGNSRTGELNLDTRDESYAKKQNCYFVLWIEWQDGVAYRKASGFILEEAWDDNRESGTVELILG